MKQWFLRFTTREQLALLLMALAVAAYLVFALVMLPLKNAREQLQATNAATVQALQRVDRTASAILALRDSELAPTRSRNLTAQLNSGAEASGVRISRLQPNNRGAVQLRLEAVPFDALLRWLHALEYGDGLLIEELSISQSGTPGIVSASLRVSQPL